MTKKKKQLVPEEMPEFDAGIASMAPDSKIFVDKSFEIATYIFHVMEAKGINQRELAEIMGKSEAEVSKMLSGMHNLTLRSISKLEAALGETVITTPRPKAYLMPKMDETRSMHFDLKSKSKRPLYNTGISYDTKVVQMNTQFSELEAHGS